MPPKHCLLTAKSIIFGLIIISILFASQGMIVSLEAQNSPATEILGDTYKFNGQNNSTYLKVGCLDHRTLMFIVHEIGGDDPKTAQMLADRDCRPLMSEALYIRCGVGGYAHPKNGEPLTYSAYCRKGAKDLQLYILDLQMSKEP